MQIEVYADKDDQQSGLVYKNDTIMKRKIYRCVFASYMIL